MGHCNWPQHLPGNHAVKPSSYHCREKTKVAKVSPGVEDGPDAKKVKLDSSETTMVKKVCGRAGDEPTDLPARLWGGLSVRMC